MATEFRLSRKEICEKLAKRFGFGADRDRRTRMYMAIADAIIRHGEEAYRVVSQVAAEAASARAPDRYFCASCVRRLEERGFMPEHEL